MMTTNAVLVGNSTNLIAANGIVVTNNPSLLASKAHADTAHAVTGHGGFQGGANALAVQGGACGQNALADSGGAMGADSQAGSGASIGLQTRTGAGVALGAFACATEDGTTNGAGINAIQIGTGGNSNALTFQVYGWVLLTTNGIIPLDRLPAVWKTNQVLGIDGTTNTLIYLGAP
jgi:hypothetical protein